MLFEAFKRNRLETPNAPAFLISSGDRSLAINWRQFTDDIALVCWLIKQYAPDGKICLLGENSYAWMVAHAACLCAGATVIPLEPALSVEEIARRVRFADASVLIHSSLYREKAHAVKAQIPGLTIGDFGSSLTDTFLNSALKALAGAHRTIWDGEKPCENSVAMMVFTSGTTSKPRAVQLSIDALETFVENATTTLSFSREQTSLMVLPLHHIYGICVAYTLLACGVALGVCPDFQRLFDAVVRFRVNFLFLVPALADILATKMEHRGATAEEALGHRLEWIVTGGAPISRRTYERLTALGVRMLAVYGLTETCACYSLSSDKDLPRACSAGRVARVRNIETKVSDTGELLIRGSNVMRGYYKRPDETARVLDADGWFHTGDIGRIDADGTVWVDGRRARTIILASGKKIAPEELEDKLLSLPGFREALVSRGERERDLRAEIFAVIPEQNIRRAIYELNQTLPLYQRIKTIIVRREPFPRTSSGKIKLV